MEPVLDLAEQTNILSNWPVISSHVLIVTNCESVTVINILTVSN